MLKNTLIIIGLVLGISNSQEAVYSLKKFKGGTPYVRLKIPESSAQWTCFDETGYEKILSLSIDAPSKDSIIDNLELQTEQCNQNESDLKESNKLLKDNFDSLKVAYNHFATEKFVELQQEKSKKWYWGAGGGLIGALIGGLVTSILIAR